MLEFALLLRMIPYLIAGYIAYKKGFKWLTIAMIYVSCVGTFSYFAKPSQAITGILASIFAFLILKHALDLKTRR